MNYFVPIHQFEIRFSRLLNFANAAPEIVAPFVPLFRDIQVENEYRKDARYIMTYDDNFIVILHNDRILFRYEGDIEHLSDNNSLVDDPFFNIFAKLKLHPLFGKVISILSYTIVVKEKIVNEDEDLANAELTTAFSKKYLKNDQVSLILDDINDVGIVLEKNTATQQISLNLGPYMGLGDIHKRNVALLNQEMIEKCESTKGYMVEARIYEVSEDASFSRYKKLLKSTEEYITKIWD